MTDMMSYSDWIRTDPIDVFPFGQQLIEANTLNYAQVSSHCSFLS